MKKNITYFFLSLSIVILSFLSCTKKDNDAVVPKPTNPSDANLRVGDEAVTIEGNYLNPYDINYTENKHNEFFIRYFEKANPTDAPRPLIITFHGGSYVGGDKKQFELPLTIGTSFPSLLTTSNLDNNKFAYASANYRLLGNPYDPSDDDLTLVDCLNDCKAFVQYMKDHATEYNIDPNKIILMGYSGGAGAALWIGLRNNFIDGVTIKGIVTLNGQATMNIAEWRDRVFVPAGRAKDYDDAIHIAMITDPIRLELLQLLQLYYKKLTLNKINTYSAENHLSYLDLINSSDPELYMVCQAKDDKTDIIHHPAHDFALKARSNAVGHKATIQFTVHPYYLNPNYESLIQFFARKFQ